MPSPEVSPWGRSRGCPSVSRTLTTSPGCRRASDPPPSRCGLEGFTPWFGRVPSGGRVGSDWLDLSSLGVVTRRLTDAALALDEVVGPVAEDVTSLPVDRTSWYERVAASGTQNVSR